MPSANIDLFLFKYTSVRAQYLSLQISWHFLTFILLLCLSCKLITDKFNIYKHVMCLVLVIYCLRISTMANQNCSYYVQKYDQQRYVLNNDNNQLLTTHSI